VESFLARRIKFSDIPLVVEKMLNYQPRLSSLSLENLLLADREVRIKTRDLIGTGTTVKCPG